MSAETVRENPSKHTIITEDRKFAEIRGVTDVVSFDEETVILETVCGSLAIEGSALHVRVLNIENGTVAMDGTINSFSYFSNEKSAEPRKKGFFGKILR